MPAKRVLAEPAVPRVLRVPDRELRLAARRRLVGQTRQGRADQTPVYRPLFDGLLIVGLRLGRSRRLRHLGKGLGALNRVWRGEGLSFGELRRGGGSNPGAHFPGHALQHLLIEHSRHLLLASLGRDLRLLVLVLGIARRAPGLLHIVANHGDDGVVGYSALAGTVVVHDVTEPRLALLHQAPKGLAFL